MQPQTQMKVNCAELEYYNANSRGKRSGDCVKRAISMAFDISYSEIEKMLNAKMKALNAYAWNIPRVYGEVIKDLGGSARIESDKSMTVNEFADNVADPNKIYVMSVAKSPSVRTTHLVCLREGRVWDSWDCRNWYVGNYYEIGRSPQMRDIQNIKDDLPSLCDFACEQVTNDVGLFMLRNSMNGSIDSDAFIKGYKITVQTTVCIRDGKTDDRRMWTISVPFVLTPTMDLQDAKEFIVKASKVKCYDRMVKVKSDDAKQVEESNMMKAAGIGPKNLIHLTSVEKKFFYSLPGWARALARNVGVSYPGQYKGSYQLDIYKLPDDNNHPDIDRCKFRAYHSYQIMDQLNRYKDTHELPDIDYDYQYH